MASNAQLTPMMAQYRRIKSELPKDALLLFRLGDFYEMFFEDAQTGAQLLNVALTKRGVVPMCGIPFHAANAYIGRLLKAGRKVAICDQMEDARPGQLVKREVTQILSPGTHFDERMLEAERNNFLAAVYPAGKTFGLAFADLTTGDFMTTEVEGEAALLTELQRLRPAEIDLSGRSGGGAGFAGRSRLGAANSAPSTSRRPVASAATGYGWILNGYDDWVFAPETALFTVREHFKVASLDGFGLKDRTAAIGAAGAVLHYLTQHLRRDVANLTRISFYQRSDFLALDFTTLRHLEILEPLHHDAPAERLALRRAEPHRHAHGRAAAARLAFAAAGRGEPIRRRQEAVQTFMDDAAGLEELAGAAGAGARPGADDRPAERRDGQRAGPGGAAPGAGANPGAEADAARPAQGRAADASPRAESRISRVSSDGEARDAIRSASPCLARGTGRRRSPNCRTWWS